MVNALRSVVKLLANLKMKGKIMKTRMMKIISKTKPVWNVGGLKKTHRIERREP
jgi:hypothetical protein